MKSQSIVSPLPYFFIGRQLTSQRIQNYSATKYGLLSQAIGKPDTKSVWYSKEHLVKLMEELEHLNGDGLRIYFGSYENNHEQFAGQTCLLMAVTRKKITADGREAHENIVLEQEPDFEERAARPKALPLWLIGSEIQGRKKDYNHGSPCPPLCDENDELDFP